MDAERGTQVLALLTCVHVVTFKMAQLELLAFYFSLYIGIKRIGVIRKRIGIGIFMIHIRFLLTGTEYFKTVFLFVLTESEYFILVFLLKENEFNILTELFV